MYGTNGNPGNPGTASAGNPGSAANPTSYNDVTINPFTAYNVEVPDGGFITIKWYAQ
jgi:hypothetical protein